MPNKGHFAWHSAVVSAISPCEQPSRNDNRKSRTQQQPSCHTLVAGFSPTPVQTQMTSLCQCVQQWNLVLKDTFCCAFHGQVDALQQVTAELRHSDCNESVLTVLDQMQCQRCLAMSAHVQDSFRCKSCGCQDFCKHSNVPSLGVDNQEAAKGVLHELLESEKLSL